MAVRLRLAAAEAADLSRRAFHVPLAVVRTARHRVSVSSQRNVSPRLPSTLDGGRWPRSERLLVEFGNSLSASLPAGVTVGAARGRSFNLRGTPVFPPPHEWPKFEQGEVRGVVRISGFGFSPISGRADMPQSRPADLARALSSLMVDVTDSMQRHQPGWPGTAPEQPAGKTKAEAELIHIWWEDDKGQVVHQLPDLDLRAADLV
jgi:hypothetical protein